MLFILGYMPRRCNSFHTSVICSSRPRGGPCLDVWGTFGHLGRDRGACSLPSCGHMRLLGFPGSGGMVCLHEGELDYSESDSVTQTKSHTSESRSKLAVRRVSTFISVHNDTMRPILNHVRKSRQQHTHPQCQIRIRIPHPLLSHQGPPEFLCVTGFLLPARQSGHASELLLLFRPVPRAWLVCSAACTHGFLSVFASGALLNWLEILCPWSCPSHSCHLRPHSVRPLSGSG